MASVPGLADAKAWLGVDYADDDAIITDCLNTATNLVGRRVGADIGTGRTDWVSVARNARTVELSSLRKYELNEPTGITIRAVTTEPRNVSVTETTGFAFQGEDWGGAVSIGASVWAAFDTAIGSNTLDDTLPVQISLTTGVAVDDIPAEWRTCILQIVAELYSNRGDMSGGRPEVVDAYLGRIGSLI